jgi:Ca2+-binding RTX toxin-like protein
MTNKSNATVNLNTQTLKVLGLSTTDVLVGITGAETYGGYDTIVGGSGAQYLSVSSGPTTPDGSFNNTILGGGGTVTLAASGVNNSTLLAGTGIDTLLATGGGVNVLKGGGGNDTLLAAESGDTLIAGNGASVIMSSSGANTTLSAGSGTDVLSASAANNTLIAGTGTDTLTDTGSNGVYWYAPGDGSDTIFNGSLANSNASNQLQFGTGLTDENLWFQRFGNNLVIDSMGTNNQITVNNWFAGVGDQLQEIVAGGLKLDSQIGNLIQAMATYSANHPGFNPATTAQAPNDSARQTAITSAWHH